MDDYWHLRRIDWLSALSPTQSNLLKRESRSRHYLRGEMIFTPTPQPSAVYLLEQGLVRIYRLSESGAEITFGYVRPGEIFGELVLFDVTSRNSFAEAATRATVRKVPRAVFARLLEARPGLVLEVTKQIGARLRRIENRVEHLVFRNVQWRVARILLELAEDFGQPESGAGVVIGVSLTQRDLATLVGSVRQTVNETLRQFEHAGWIRHAGRHLVLLKRDELQRVAESGQA
jgi:CRP-like cAMP-binding protein